MSQTREQWEYEQKVKKLAKEITERKIAICVYAGYLPPMAHLWELAKCEARALLKKQEQDAGESTV